MGDSGSLVLGFLLATISLRSTPSVKASATLAILVPILALGLPVIDTLIVMWLRFLRGHHRVNRIARMFHADRAHVHHVLLDNYSERRSVLVVLFSLAALFCGMALWVAASDNWHLGVAFLVLEVVAMILVRRSGMASATSQMTAREVDQMITSGEVTKCTDIESSQDAPKPPLDAGLEAKTPTVL
jgi:UDP-GlcNAc:undecaprenyl-phosphate GlcNAc-1-phosphate transferase